uniref:Uncharacterized protein n=1 Tax=viral metagenome TaxID=1070528 RepID=A0A6C0H8X9_9ZZZZ
MFIISLLEINNKLCSIYMFISLLSYIIIKLFIINFYIINF